MTQIEFLQSGDIRLEVCPAAGGSITRFSIEGQDILRPASEEAIKNRDPGLMAAFPMVPYCNRIAHGSFWFEGRQIQLKKNFEPELCSIHGLGWQRAWSIEHKNMVSLKLSYDHDGHDWPWKFHSEQFFRLEPDRLNYELSISNADSSAMPAGLGLHPFFFEQRLARMSCLFQGRWQCSSEGLPSHFVERVESDQFDASKAMSQFDLDHVYTSLNSDICLKWDNQKYGVSLLKSEGNFGYVVYSPPDGDFFCVEPISHLPNVINMDEQAGTMRVLEPGDSMSMCQTFVILKE